MAKDPSLRKQNDLAREVDRLLRQLPFADPMLRGDTATAPRSAPVRAGSASTITRRAPAATAAPLPSSGASTSARRVAPESSAFVTRRASAEPSALAQTISAWLRALLAAALGAAVSIWPYASDCGWMLYLALFVIATVMIAGAWASIWAWRLQAAAAHVLSLAVIFWGVVLAAEQVLPRIGYAAVSAAWACVGR